VLEKAQALITPGPADSEIDGKSILEAYTRLADVYRTLQQPTRELFAIMSAIEVTRDSKDKGEEDRLTAYLAQRFRELDVYDQTKRAITESRLVDVLAYSEAIFTYEGSPKDWTGDENWNRICNIPYQLIKEPGGPEALVEILSQMGPLATFSKLPILQALSGYFVMTNPKPELAESYALEANSYFALGDFGHFDAYAAWKGRTICQLAIIYAREMKLDLAESKSVECIDLANKTDDVSLKDFANAANALVQLAANNPAAAEASVEYFLAKHIDDPELHLELASALISKNLYEKGVAEFNTAIKQLREKKDANAEAAAFARVASTLSSVTSSQYKKQQLEYLKSAENLYKQTNNPHGTATVDLDIGSYYLDIGDSKTALPYLHQAQTLGQQVQDPRVSARALLLLGNSYNGLHDYQKAGEFHASAEVTYDAQGDKSQAAMMQVLLAQDLEAQGKLDDAINTCRTAEEIATQSKADLATYWASRTLGEIYQKQGEFEKAAEALERAVTIANRSGQQQNEAYTEILLTTPYMILGQFDDALNATEKALGTFKALEDKQGEMLANVVLGEIYSDRTSSIRDFEKAMAYYSTAKQLGYASNDELLEIYLQTGRYSEAITAAKGLVAACIKVRDNACQAGALITLAENERKNGNLAESALALRNARRGAVESKDVYLQGRLLYGEAGQERAEGHLQQALESYSRLITLVESIKGEGDLSTLRSMAESYGFIYDELTSTLYAMSAGESNPEKTRLASLALQYAETNKARTFSKSWGRTFISELRQSLPADLQERERSLASRRDQLRAKTEGPELKPELDSVQKEIASFVEDLRHSHPQYAAVAYPQPVTLDSLPVRKEETLVECKVTDESTFIWIVKSSNGTSAELIAFYQVAKPREWISERTNKIRKELNDSHGENVDWRASSEELFDQLFPGQVPDLLLGSKKIVFIPDDTLFLIPFELLSPEASKDDFPLLKIPTAYYPSAAAFTLARTTAHNVTWQQAFLGIADPITSKDDKRYDSVEELAKVNAGSSVSEVATLAPTDLEKLKSRGDRFEPLPNTKKEVQDIAGLFRDAGQADVELRWGFDATKSQLLDTDLTKFRFLHFATHGNSSLNNPALILSYDGSDQHMLLSVPEIAALKIKAESVVLSACDTGYGTVSRAEGVTSLGVAFMTAGAESVTVSLWEVGDESTQVLMEEYYKNLLQGKSKAEALAMARSYLFADKRYSNPYFWAPFVLIGD